MERKIVVMKFGGTSVADAKAIRQVTAIVRKAAESQQVIVVVSAMSGMTTRLLEATASDAMCTPSEAFAKEIVDRYKTELSQLAGESSAWARFGLAAHEFTRRIISKPSVSVLHAAWSADVVAYGEIFSTILMCVALQNEGLPASITDARFLFATDSTYLSASLLPWAGKRIKRMLSASLEAGLLPVVAGYIGANENRETTLFGRGGSDLSATAIGAAIGAGRVILYKNDVPGIMTADPRVIDGSRKLRDLSYEDAAEIAAYGGNVLHPLAIAAIEEWGIPVEVRHTANPDEAGTVVCAWSTANRKRLATAVTSLPVGIVRISGKGMRGEVGLAKRVFAVAADEKVSVVMFGQSSSETDIWLAVDKHCAARLAEAIKRAFEHEMQLRRISAVECDREKAVVAVIGDALSAKSRVGLAFRALEDADIEFYAPQFGPERRNISCIVAAADAAKALGVLHDAFDLAREEGSQ